MEIDLIDIDNFINKNNCGEVTSPNYYIPNTTNLNPNGLFSEEIFGSPGTPERKQKWGYISLNDTFMHPHAFYVLSRLKKNIAEDMRTGTNRYYVDKTGEITKLDKDKTVPSDAVYSVVGSGFDWLKEAWPHITWRITKDMSYAAKTRRKFLKCFSIGAIFWDKFPICPAFYRDVDFKSNKRSIINTMYMKLFNLAQIIKNTDNLIFSEDYDTPLKSISYAKCQSLINEIALFFFGKIGGADGFINKHVVGKSTDYGARLVISTPSFNTERYTEAETDFFHSAVPMAVAINIFSPFTIYGLKRWIINYVHGARFATIFDFKQQKFVEYEISVSFLDEFTTDKIKRILDLYKKSKTFRVEPVTLKSTTGERIPVQGSFKYLDTEKMVDIKTGINIAEAAGTTDVLVAKECIRNLTWCELFYVIASNSLYDKTIDNTRYPVDDYYHTYPSLMNIIPCSKYGEVLFDGVKYNRYPIVGGITNATAEHSFIDSMKLFSIYPASLGADFDGDQISTQGLFADESTDEAKKQMNSISHIVGIDGQIMREFPQVVRHGLYGLTYRIEKGAS